MGSADLSPFIGNLTSNASGDTLYFLQSNNNSASAPNMEAFREFMVKKLTNINHIGSTHSMFMISEVKYTTAITL